jgi:hypothetical protein
MSVQDSRRADAESATTTANEHVGSHLGKVFGVSVLAALIVTVFVLAFTWPTKTSEAHNMPVSVAGPKKAVDQFEDKINEKSGDTFDFVSADSRDDAVDQIKHRETYGAVILAEQPGTPEVLTAPASNSAATQVMSGIADQLTQQIKGQITGQVEQMKAASGGQLKPEQAQKALAMQEKAADTKVAETEVVPLSDDDSNGSGLAVAAFPLVLGGMLGGVMITFLVKGVWRRLIAAVAYGAAAGLSLTLILHTWFGFVQGNFGLVWLAFGLSAMATATFILGCTAILGAPGIGIGAVVTMLLGNPLSGAQVPWQFMVEPWGRIGQYMVPGASNTLLRSLSYFPDAPMAQQWWTLVVWVAVGVALTAFGHFRHNRINDEPEESHDADGRQLGGESAGDAGNHPAPRHRRGGSEVAAD